MTDMVDRVLETYGRADAATLAEGRDWYPAALAHARIVASLADAHIVTTVRVIAALSPRNPWLWNLADAHAVLTAARDGHASPPNVTTFARNRDVAWRTATGHAEADWRSAAPKVRAFVDAILGDATAVVVDVWAYRVAVGLRPDHSVRPAEYRAIAAAYAEAARRVGETPRDMQAIVWLVSRDSLHRPWHGRRPKMGTHPDLLPYLQGVS